MGDCGGVATVFDRLLRSSGFDHLVQGTAASEEAAPPAPPTIWSGARWRLAGVP